MPPLTLHWVAHGSPAYQAAVALRDEILRKPLGMHFTPEQLAAEAEQWHLVVLRGQQTVGTLVMVPKPEGRIVMRQVAVTQGMQGSGIGRLMVLEAERRAKEEGFTWLTLHARDVALPFYYKLGYEDLGAPFIEIGIPHQEVQKRL